MPIIPANITQSINIVADPSIELRVNASKKTNLPKFTAIGVEGEYLMYEKEEDTNKIEIEGVDPFAGIVRRGGSMNYSLMLSTLIVNRDFRTNIAILVPKSKAESNAIGIAYKELREENKVIRIKRQTYLLNPYMVFPFTPNRQDVINEWNKLLNK